jgi:hypothetical protein
LAQILRSTLAEEGDEAVVTPRLGTVPTVTPTGKAAVAPLTRRPESGAEFTPNLGGTTFSASALRKQLEAEGVQVLSDEQSWSVNGRGWTELADLDATGHSLELKLVDRIAQEVAAIASGIRQLLDDGWARVHVVTDHGWLLMPGGLPKVELPEHLTEVRKPRCARLHDGAPADPGQPVYPWTWDPSVRIAVPRGIAAFTANRVYEHGGVSPQESITPHVVVTRGAAIGGVKIDGVKWISLRCRIDYSAAPSGAVVELRRSPGDASSAVATSKKIEGTAEVSVLVADDALIGEPAYVVILSGAGEILAQLPTTIGS